MDRFKRYEAGYRRLWEAMEVRKGAAFDAQVAAAANMIARGKSTYRQIEADTGVPWFFIGMLHKMECKCDFTKHLHNGDALTARTRRVPKGRPLNGKPPFTFRESAIDALTMKGLHKISDWSLERIAYEAERYNGFGYRQVKVNIPSPYLWSFSNHYTRGKYVADHVYSASAVSKQVGVMVVFRALADRDADVAAVLDGKVSVAAPVQPEQMDEDEVLPVARVSIADRIIDAIIDALIALFGRRAAS